MNLAAASPNGFGVLDGLLAVLLATGCLLGLPIYWWLFGTPFVRLWQWWRTRRRAARPERADASVLKPPAGFFYSIRAGKR